MKMWRVFPYAEESLCLLRTFSCCRPATVLCALGKRVTVGFEDPDSATYGLVQFGLGNSLRYDHRPQDDPTDHITGEGQAKNKAQAILWPWSLTLSPGPSGLCCCPTLKLYACSSLDCTIRIWTAENRLLRWVGAGKGGGGSGARRQPAGLPCLCPQQSPEAGPGKGGLPLLVSQFPPLEQGWILALAAPSRLLRLNGAPQALTFCSDSGDLVLALGSRLCLVSHRLYLPTSYLVKVCSGHRIPGQSEAAVGRQAPPGQSCRFLSPVQKLCRKVPDVVDDPPLPPTTQESLTSAQLQRLASLRGVASLRSAGPAELF